MGVRRAGYTATLLASGQVLVAGGCCGRSQDSRLASTEPYDPRTGRWTPSGSMITSREYHTATLLRDGQVLVAGGIHVPVDGDGCRGHPPLQGRVLRGSDHRDHRLPFGVHGAHCAP